MTEPTRNDRDRALIDALIASRDRRRTPEEEVLVRALAAEAMRTQPDQAGLQRLRDGIAAARRPA